MNSRNRRFLGSVVLAVGVGGSGFVSEVFGQISCPAEIPGSTCVCDEQVSDITICVDWEGTSADPIPFNDFSVDFACPGCPGAPNISLKTAGFVWVVRSRKSDGSFGDIGTLSSPWPQNFNVKLGTSYLDPGAQNVGSINLNPSGVMGDPNYANLVGGAIRGDLTGSLVVSPNSAGVGGECTLFIDGQMQGKTSVHVVQSLKIFGGTSGPLTIDRIAAGGILEIGDPFVFNGCPGYIQVASPINIGVMDYGSQFWVWGELLADVNIAGPIGPSSEIGFKGAVRDVRVDVGPILTGGTGPTTVDFGISGPAGICPFEADLSMASGVNINTQLLFFASLEPGSSIDLKGQNVSGPLYVRYGGSGSIDNGGAVQGFVTLADRIATPYAGTATFAGVESGGTIQTLSGADMNGTLAVKNDMRGSVKVDGSLGSMGRILVNGLCDGSITVGEETSKLSLIHMTGGLGAEGSVTVNSSQNIFDANGDIYIGPTKWTQMPNVTFDGTIQIIKGLGGGNLNGDITVVGCHATADDLAICVEGAVNGKVSRLSKAVVRTRSIGVAVRLVPERHVPRRRAGSACRHLEVQAGCARPALGMPTLAWA